MHMGNAKHSRHSGSSGSYDIHFIIFLLNMGGSKIVPTLLSFIPMSSQHL